MARSVWKFKIPVGVKIDFESVWMPERSEIVRVGQQEDEVYVWALIDTAARFRPGDITTPTAAAKYAMSLLARRIQHLDTELAGLDEHLKTILTAAHPALLAAHGVGPDTAGALLVAAGDNPERLATEQS